MDRYFVFALRAAIALAILIGFFGQLVVIPGTAAGEVDRFPPYAPFAVPYMTVAIIGVACIQLALLAVWILLDMLRRDALFTSQAFRWVDVIIGSTVVATLLAVGVTVHLLVFGVPMPDAMEAISALGVAVVAAGVGASFAMLLVLMRGLLRKATDLQTEIAEVV
ncbi:DUF2975 domain-containing protein [Nocardiopsis ansamitocini]|uniref:DUF2975 domain-containing protein n=1 Tax=Nocardiopsis ansamitocini TaxID=1670832 RepID=A0A9W6P4T4_9ACTN|nr:DUF2975 domain-containing protein [Nocardiopsis ansamitocini]GLU47079.1 hypothetical protein Nans01_14300 [Nocardiopsis ansamitocini]